MGTLQWVYTHFDEWRMEVLLGLLCFLYLLGSVVIPDDVFWPFCAGVQGLQLLMKCPLWT